MKRTILSILFFGILLTSCENKSGQQNDTEIENTPDININGEPKKDPRYDSAKAATLREYLYKSENGEIINVSFFEVYGAKYVEVKRNKEDAIILDQISASARRSAYEKKNYTWISQNGEATFSNGIYFLKLTLVSPLIHTYTNSEKEITVTYFIKDNKRFVTIQKDSLPGITLEQTATWPQGAEYGKGPVQWRSQGNTGILTEDGIRTEFKEKE